jgi:RNA polymerase sigma factor (sigma-70 family)
MMSDDMTLVREFAASQSEPAFAALVERHVALVHSAALRQTGDAHLAEEITQAVFIILARKAASLGPKTVLSAWLYRTTRYAAADALRAKRRRQAREQEAHMQSILNQPDADLSRRSETEADVWAQLAPLLDDALAELGETDRAALVLRFFENKTAREIAGALRMEEAAAQKRVARALEKLRAIFMKRGVTLTATVIAGAVAANSVQAAPAGLAAVAATAAKGTTVAASIVGLVKGTTKLIAWAKFKFAVGVSAAALLAGGVAGVLVLHSTKAPSYNPTLARQMIQAVFSHMSSPLPAQMRFVAEVEVVNKPWTEAQISKFVEQIEESSRKYQEKVAGLRNEDLAKLPKAAQEQRRRVEAESREMNMEIWRSKHGTQTFIEQEWLSSGSGGLCRLDQTETTRKPDRLHALENPNPIPVGVDYASTLVNIGDPHFSDLTSWRIDYALRSAELRKGGPGASKWEIENFWEARTIEPSIAFLLTLAVSDLTDLARQAQAEPHSDIDSFAGVKLDTNKLEAIVSGKDGGWIVETDEAVLYGRKMAVLRLKGKNISLAHGEEIAFFADANHLTNFYRIELTGMPFEMMGIPLIKTPYISIRDDFDSDGFPHTWIVETPKGDPLKKTVKFKEVDFSAEFDNKTVFLPQIPTNYLINGGRAIK